MYLIAPDVRQMRAPLDIVRLFHVRRHLTHLLAGQTAPPMKAVSATLRLPDTVAVYFLNALAYARKNGVQPYLSYSETIILRLEYLEELGVATRW